MELIKNGVFKSDLFAKPDTSIDKKALEEHYKQFPERWEIAFKFLSEMDTSNLPFSRTYLSKDVYVFIDDEYLTKNEEDALYESHKDYIDIQHMIKGEEYIGLTRDSNLIVSSSYNKEKDITFYKYDGGKKLLATPENFYVFFPKDIHRPCMKISNNKLVKKIVIKIRYGN
jgi:YhcH/YjgK/YiaL family protein